MRGSLRFWLSLLNIHVLQGFDFFLAIFGSKWFWFSPQYIGSFGFSIFYWSHNLGSWRGRVWCRPLSHILKMPMVAKLCVLSDSSTHILGDLSKAQHILLIICWSLLTPILWDYHTFIPYHTALFLIIFFMLCQCYYFSVLSLHIMIAFSYHFHCPTFYSLQATPCFCQPLSIPSFMSTTGLSQYCI